MLCAKDLEDCGGGRVLGQRVANVLALESCLNRSHHQTLPIIFAAFQKLLLVKLI
jgi:hypothetical protein